MKNFFKSALGGCIATLSVLSSGSVFAQTPVTVVEYYNKTVAGYFITARADEIALLDANPNLFTRTGKTFGTFAAAAAPSGYAPICRYQFLVPPSQFSSHFYGLPSDCTYIADTIRQLNLTNFTYEGLDFATLSPNANGTCPANAPVPIYRSFRKLSPVDVSNHRYSVNATEYAEMTRRGWAQENVVFCATTATPEPPRPLLADSDTLKNSCAVPRAGTSPYTGAVYPDRQGTAVDEKSFLRSYYDKTYLWYREVESIAPTGPESVATYFSKFKTFAKTNTLQGGGGTLDKDQFHFTQNTNTFEASRSGTTFGYGISWSRISSSPPRRWVVSVVTQGSPAQLAGVNRGDEIVSIDGVNFVNGNNVAALNAGLSPPTVGELHNFEFKSVGTAQTKLAALTSAAVPSRPVSDVNVINTSNGRVGYIAFQSFGSNVSERALAEAFTSLANAGVDDLVLDLRYNGGGLLNISAALGYMIAGPSRTAGKIYERIRTNDKFPFGTEGLDTPFYSTGQGFSVTRGTPLPTLNLSRVYILTSDQTCSASEAAINGLRGVDVDVKLVGATTCGKPYGFFSTDNCGTTYSSIQIDGVNNKGEGDYIAGFSATCPAVDDLSKPLGDPAEGQLAAALAFRRTGTCAPVTGATKRAVKFGGDQEARDAGFDVPDLGSTVKLVGAKPPLNQNFAPLKPAEIKFVKDDR
jgi:carboxyl-terminal processing protease